MIKARQKKITFRILTLDNENERKREGNKNDLVILLLRGMRNALVTNTDQQFQERQKIWPYSLAID